MGFDAADPARISARSLAEEMEGVGDVDDEPQHRLVFGYGALVRAMARALPPARVEVRTGVRVEAIRWRRGRVAAGVRLMDGSAATFTARRAVVTLPLPFLQMDAGDRRAVRFEPDVPEVREAARRLAMGPVVKLALAFREPFWEGLKDERGEALADLQFLQAPGGAFPTFWTAHPVHTPVLTAWAGGPIAEALSGQAAPALVRAALGALADALGQRRAYLARRLVAAHAADWLADPLALGAYSYVAVGGMGARASLARPVDNTLFFAGEATDTGGQASTVAGALASGERAALEVIGSG